MYQISWQAHSTLDDFRAALHRQLRDILRHVLAGQAGGCTVSVLARRTASKASAAFQACQRGLRILQMQGSLSGAYIAVNSMCMTLKTGFMTWRWAAGASVTVQLHTGSLLSTCSAALGRSACTSQAVHALLRCAAAESDASVSAWQGPQAALAASAAAAARVGSQHSAAGDANLLMIPLLLPMGAPVEPGHGGPHVIQYWLHPNSLCTLHQPFLLWLVWLHAVPLHAERQHCGNAVRELCLHNHAADLSIVASA